MRILYFSPQECWPLTTGARLRNYHLASQLARDAGVTYFGLRGPEDAATPIPAEHNPFEAVVSVAKTKSYTPLKLVRGALGPEPVTVLNFWSHPVAGALEQTLRAQTFDTVQVESVHLLRYVDVIRACSPRSAIIADWHNIESEIMWRYTQTAPGLAHRIFGRRTAQLIEGAEVRLLRGCDAHTVASDREREKLERRDPAARLYTIPNGVDVASYRHSRPALRDARSGDEILFVGSMDYHANVDAAEWFVREVWPLLTAHWPEVRLTIVGRDPDPRVRSLANDLITVTGTVDDVRPYYARALAVIAPLRVGSGTRLKILEAMAAGVPVVSTGLGAEGLEVTSGRNLLLADTPEEIASALVRLKADPALKARLALAAADLVEQLYDWSRLGDQLREVHRKTAANRVNR